MTKSKPRRKAKVSYLIFDGSHACYRAMHATGYMQYKGRQTGVTYGFLNIIRAAIEKFNPAKAIICWDGGQSATRKEIYPEYKAHRKKKSSESSEADQAMMASMFSQITDLKNILNFLAIPQVRLKKTEADDVIASISLHHTLNETVVIVSGDRDFAQLVDHRISLYRPQDEQFITLESFGQFLDTPDPQRYLWLKTVMGDKTDNITKVLGIGEKKIPHILENTDEDFWTDILSGMKVRSADPIIKKLIENQGLLMRNWQLVNLRDFQDIHLPHEDEITNQLADELIVQERQVQKVFFALGFKEFLSRFNSFMRTFKQLTMYQKELM